MTEADASPKHIYIYEDSVRGEFKRRAKQHAMNATVRDVCVACNSGWMNRIEEGVRPVIGGMLQGRRRELHPSGQAALARWAVLKGLVAQRAFHRIPAAETPLLLDDYEALYASRDDDGLPPHFNVFTARTGWSRGPNGGVASGFYRLNTFARTSSSDPEPIGYAFCFTSLDVATLTIRIDTNELVEPVALSGSRDIAAALARIWPAQPTFAWPKGPTLSMAGVRSIAGGGVDGAASHAPEAA